MLVQDTGKRNTHLCPPNPSLSFLHSFSEWKARLFSPAGFTFMYLSIHFFCSAGTQDFIHTKQAHYRGSFPSASSRCWKGYWESQKDWWREAGCLQELGVRVYIQETAEKEWSSLLCKVTFGELRIQEVQWSEKALERKMDPQLHEFSHWEEVTRSPNRWGCDTGLGTLQKSWHLTGTGMASLSIVVAAHLTEGR